MTDAALPIESVLPALLRALAAHGRAVLAAPPGAGKTTRVPLAMLEAGTPGRIVMLEPRRLAARAAAERMAESLGEAPGGRVGYRMRGAATVSAATRIEVVTEGLFTRMIQDDPSLSGIGAVIFDEFHERSLHADLGLALAWEAKGALSPDLRLLVMSATLEAAPVAALLDDAPVIRAEGRAHPVETRWLHRPAPRDRPLPEAAADLARRALDETGGGVLVFLPGAAEIRRAARALARDLPAGVMLRPLYGAMPFAEQRRAIAPEAGARKLVLATAIAETALTIEDVRVVIDAGRARRARFDPGTGMTRLVTEPVSRAEADQRRGRAGRVAPGVCYRLWTRGAEGGLPAQPPPEIAIGDLAGFALDLAEWGAEPADLALLTPPNPGALAEARALLALLGALDGRGRITAHGKALARLPLHPRLGHMMTVAGRPAAPLAALMEDRDPMPGAGADIAPRLAALGEARDGPLRRIAAEARRLARRAPAGSRDLSPGAMLALAWPDRVALRRPGTAPRYLLSNGTGAVLEADDSLAGQRLLVAAELTSGEREARIRRAAALAEDELRALFPERIGWHEIVEWSEREGRVRARREERFGALALARRNWPEPPPARVAGAMLAGLRARGLPWTEAARALQARARHARAAGADLPDLSDEALMAGLEGWLGPFLPGTTGGDPARLDILPALEAMLGHEGRRTLARLAPARLALPSGREVAVDYSGEAPAIAVRLQEMLGTDSHPALGGVALRLTLLSPAGRPLQTTTDLPGFWRGEYSEVRKEMRGRYPKHAWPETPQNAPSGRR